MNSLGADQSTTGREGIHSSSTTPAPPIHSSTTPFPFYSQLHLSLPCHSQVPQDRISQMFAEMDVDKSGEVLAITSRPILSDAFRCLPMPSDAFRCLPMPSDALLAQFVYT